LTADVPARTVEEPFVFDTQMFEIQLTLTGR
jgi:hypothetical protein